MMKVTIEIGKITVQCQDSKDCRDVLKTIYPQFLEAHKNQVQAPVTQEVIVPSIETTNKQETLGRYENEADFSGSFPLVVTEEAPKIREDRKKLVFFKCEECGTIACSFTNPSEPARCYCCGHLNKLEKLYRGSYNCSCGQEGVFLMQDQVSEVECKTCKTKHIMVKDSRKPEQYVSLTI